MSMYGKAVKRPTVICGPSKTQQHNRDANSVTKLIAKYGAKRLADTLALEPSRYGDISGFTDYADSLNRINRANDAFDAMPSAVRNRFHNDPAELIAFLNDDKNRSEAIILGLIPAPAEPVIDPVVTELQGLRKDVSSTRKSRSKSDDE